MDRKLTLLSAPYIFDSKFSENQIVFKTQPKVAKGSAVDSKTNRNSESIVGAEFLPPEGMDWDQYGNPYLIEK
jgi:hypothetical protein